MTATSTLEAPGNGAEIANFGSHEVLVGPEDYTQTFFYDKAPRLVSDMRMCGDLGPNVLGLDTETQAQEHVEGQVIR